MKYDLINILACPECGSNFKLQVYDVENKEIKSGRLICEKNLHNYKIINFIPRFVLSDEYADNFSFEWDKHKQTQFDSISGINESETMFRQKTGFDANKLSEKLVLDVGCGSGRYMEVVQKYGGHIVGIDLSYSVDVAFKNLGFKKNVDVIQADVFKLPFKKEIFDNIFSIGVLHHTPNTRKAFECLPQFLKKGGEIAIWVYSNEGLSMKLINSISWLYRLMTTRLPKQWIYKFSYISLPLYRLKTISFIRPILELILPTSTHKLRDWRILDTFDWYSPKYQWKHTHKEVMKWFADTGLVEIKKSDIAVSVKGKKC